MTKYRNTLARMGGVLLLAGAFVVANAAQADAALKIYACDDAGCGGGGDTVITDDLGGDLDAGTPGSLIVNLGGGSIQVALSYPAEGSQARPVLNIRYSLTSAYTGGRYIYVTQDGFSPTQASLNFIANATAGSGLGAAFGGAGSFVPPAIFGAGSLFGPAALPINTSFAGPLADPYFLAIGLNLGLSGLQSGDATIFVPEPAMMALFGLGLFGAGMASRRRKQQDKEIA